MSGGGPGAMSTGGPGGMSTGGPGAGAGGEAGRAMVRTMLGAHAALRRDLDSLGEAVRLLAAGGPQAAGEVRARMDDLTMRQAAWQLKSFCDFYCQRVHAHHSVEDFRVFPSVLRIAPELRPVIERLTADHLELGTLLDTMLAAVAALPGPDAAWRAAEEAVQALADHLAAHLDLEEAHIIPQLGRLSSWV